MAHDCCELCLRCGIDFDIPLPEVLPVHVQGNLLILGTVHTYHRQAGEPTVPLEAEGDIRFVDVLDLFEEVEMIL